MFLSGKVELGSSGFRLSTDVSGKRLVIILLHLDLEVYLFIVLGRGTPSTDGLLWRAIVLFSRAVCWAQ